MPVVATLTIIALLRDNASSDQPFFDPALLRDMLAEGLEGEPADLIGDAMALADELESLIDGYRSRVDSTMDAYIAASEVPNADAEGLGASLTAIDKDRSDLMRDIIGIRRSLAELLTDEQWQAVFN